MYQEVERLSTIASNIHLADITSYYTVKVTIILPSLVAQVLFICIDALSEAVSHRLSFETVVIMHFYHTVYRVDEILIQTYLMSEMGYSLHVYDQPLTLQMSLTKTLLYMCTDPGENVLTS